MQKSELTAKLEALLFCYGEPIAIKKAAEILEARADEVKEAARAMEVSLIGDASRGLALIIKEDWLQLTTKPELSFVVEKIIRSDLREELTPAALETLAVIAYLQPISRAEIDYLRGVNSTFILRVLVLRGLVQRSEKRNEKGFYTYSVSFDFLKHLGVTRVEDMPDYEKYRGFLDRIRKNGESNKAKF